MMPIPDNHPLRRWMTGLVENTFHAEVGMCEPAVLDYIAEMLTEFIHVERINLVGDGSHRSIEDLAELLNQAEARIGMSDEMRRELYRHVGDYTLFWTGVYPENLRRMHRRHAKDDLLDYFEQGKRSYAIASELSDDAAVPPARQCGGRSSCWRPGRGGPLPALRSRCPPPGRGTRRGGRPRRRG